MEPMYKVTQYVSKFMKVGDDYQTVEVPNELVALEGSTMTTEQKDRIRKIAKMTNQELKEYGADLEEWRFELKQEAERRRRHD